MDLLNREFNFLVLFAESLQIADGIPCKFEQNIRCLLTFQYHTHKAVSVARRGRMGEGQQSCRQWGGAT